MPPWPGGRPIVLAVLWCYVAKFKCNLSSTKPHHDSDWVYTLRAMFQVTHCGRFLLDPNLNLKLIAVTVTRLRSESLAWAISVSVPPKGKLR